ncbi:methionine ABC transporter ATP-binding protein, partial [Neisseria meningitidis]|nr:methionine ABC transporter ATP-binding protein [Neisseria meningitidis]
MSDIGLCCMGKTMIILDKVSKHYQTRDKTRFAAV